MKRVTLVLLAAGDATRFALPVKKQWVRCNETPLWQFVAERFETFHDFARIIVVGAEEELRLMRYFADYDFVAGGKTRQASLQNALCRVDTPWVLVHDVARPCLSKEALQRILRFDDAYDAVVPALQAVDTVYYDNAPLDRSKIRLIQTPQLSRTAMLKRALQSETLYSDESSAIAAIGGKIAFVEGDKGALKLTFADDLTHANCLPAPSQRPLVGYGIDTHAFEVHKPMKLCGVSIESDVGFKAHSDGDVAIHALIDALLGAAGIGDIGEFFPDSDAAYKGIESTELLKRTVTLLRTIGLRIGNVDLTIVAQSPKLSPYKLQMRKNLAAFLGVRPSLVNIKATTSEKLGFIGRKEGISVHATALLQAIDPQSLSRNDHED